MFQRPNGFDIKNSSDCMMPQRMPLMRSVSIELWHNPLQLIIPPHPVVSATG